MNSNPQSNAPDPAVEQIGLVAVGTLVLWLTTLAVGVSGTALHYGWPRAPVRSPEPVRAEVVHVELTNDAMPAADIAAPAPPDAAQAPAPPDAPAPVAVAAPGAPVAFAIPVEGPTQEVEARLAVPLSLAPTTAPVAVRHLTYGRGEGHQPAPEYPREAVVDREQGTVVVRFNVNESGRVVDAEALVPSPWPLLNQAAVRALRETWRFGPGPMRSYEVSIQFQLRSR